MSIVKFNPDVDSYLPSSLGNLFNSFANQRDVYSGDYRAATDIYETDEAFEIDIALPGFKKDSFDLEVVDNVLKIKGERNEKNLDEGTYLRRSEISYTNFERSYTLPENLNPKKFSAVYEEGILAIKLPKVEKTQLKSRISVK